MTKRAGVGLIYVIVVLMTLLLRVSGGLDIYGRVNIDSDLFFALVVQVLIFGVLPFVLYFLFCKKGENNAISSLFDDLSFKKTGLRNWGRTIAIGVCMIIVASALSYFWQVVLTQFGYTRTSSKTDLSTVKLLMLQLFITALLPAVFEEFTHRGLLMAGYRDLGYKAVLVSALLFSLMHQNITQTGYTFFDGIVLALLVYYTRSIYPAIFVHFFNNFISVMQSYGAQNGGFFNFMNVISDWFYDSFAGYAVNMALVVASVVLMIFLFKRMRKDAVKNGIVTEAIPMRADVSALPLKKDVFFICTVIIGVAATIFTLVWGILR